MENLTLKPEDIQTLGVEELMDKLQTGPSGLSESEAATRLEEYGPNELSEQQINPFLKFLGYFWGPIPWMIEIAATLSAAVHRWEDFWIIVALLLLNAIVAFWQEHKADNAIAMLKQRLALKARVFRDGRWLQIEARELVPGDKVRVRLGEILPADLKLSDGDYLLVDESALTGESLPIEKHASDTAYSGAIVRQGEMEGFVTATGMSTLFGRTARLVEQAQTKSHFQKAIVKIGDYLIVLALALVTVIILVALFRHESLIETVQYALILTVAAIPAALPAVLSVTMAVGATKLAQKEAIVSKLVAIEEMAGMTILCSDKTGTITKNELTVGQVTPFEGFRQEDVLTFGSLASREEDQDPIDSAILSATKESVGSNPAGTEFKIVGFTPFDPVSKRSEAVVEGASGERFKVAKGAPQAILDLLPPDPPIAAALDDQVNDFASKGYRALGVAKGDATGQWHYAGLIALYDPPREDSAQTIRTAGEMGVSVKMVTGDHTAIAKQIAEQVGLGSQIVPAQRFLDEPDRTALPLVEQSDGFAQVFPEHKYRIVELLQEKDHIVGMTGDGVNDAPALKKADVGIAVAGATDAARSAADIVLTKPGLSVIIDALKESRRIFQRMHSYAVYRIAETIRVLFFITLSILVFRFYPVTAVMIVLLALLNDAPIMAIAYDNVRYSPEPERWDMRIVLGVATFLGLLGVVSSFLIFYIARDVFHLGPDLIQSLIFLKLAVAGHMTIFLARTRGPFWTIRPSNSLFWSAVITKILATLVVVYGFYMTPLGWKLALFVWGYVLIAFALTDYLKLLIYEVLDHSDVKLTHQEIHG